MQFIDLKTQYSHLQPLIHDHIQKVLEHGQYIMGPEVALLEETLSIFVGTKHCIACSNGTDALLLALMAYDVEPGDAIITSPFTFFATAEVIASLGARPIFIDISPDTYNLDADRLEHEIQKVKQEGKYRLRGIMPVDLFGLPADYDAILTIARRHGLFVIQDGAQAFGGRTSDGRRSPGHGDIGTTSFFPAKPLGGYGDGGAMFTDNDRLAVKLRSLLAHGKGKYKYEHDYVGMNGRLDTLQAAILLAKFSIFPQEIEMRQQVAKRYTQALSCHLKTPCIPEGCHSVWAQYCLISDRKQEIMNALNRAFIPTMVYYPVPLHLTRALSFLGYQSGDFPVAEESAEKIFSIPMHPYLTAEEQNMIISIILSVFHE